MLVIVPTTYAILGKLSGMVRTGSSVTAALEKTFDVETMKAIDRNNDGQVGLCLGFGLDLDFANGITFGLRAWMLHSALC
jgi:hypothetical protein